MTEDELAVSLGSCNVSIFDIADMSAVDGPGTRTVVFFQGCGICCAWCHSPHSKAASSPLLFHEDLCGMCRRCMENCERGVHTFSARTHNIERKICIKCGKCILACPQSSMITGCLRLPTKTIPLEDLIKQVMPCLSLCDGITLSGGEAILQTGAALLLRFCKGQSINTCVETSGLADTALYTGVSPFVDTWLFGVRVLTDVCSDNSSNFHSHKLISNIKAIKASSKAEILPIIPLIPEVMDREDVLAEILDVLKAAESSTVLLNPWNHFYDVYYKASGLALTFAKPTEEDIQKCEKTIMEFLTVEGFAATPNKI